MCKNEKSLLLALINTDNLFHNLTTNNCRDVDEYELIILIVSFELII